MVYWIRSGLGYKTSNKQLKATALKYTVLDDELNEY